MYLGTFSPLLCILRLVSLIGYWGAGGTQAGEILILVQTEGGPHLGPNKVAQIFLNRSLTHSLVRSLTHSLTH